MLTITRQLKIALHGFDDRFINSMAAFLHGPCLEMARISAHEEADVDVFDYDLIPSKKLFERHLEEGLLRPAIVLSLFDYSHDGVIHLRKPVGSENMLEALEHAKRIAEKVSHISVEYGITKIPIISVSADRSYSSDCLFPVETGSLDSGDQLQQISDWFDEAVA